MSRSRASSTGSHSSTRYTADERTFAPSIFQADASKLCSLVLALGGVVLVVTGVIYGLGADEKDRNKSVDIYNAAVKNWTDIYRSQFEEIDQVTFHVDSVKKIIKLAENTKSDPTDPDNDDLVSYVPLRYSSLAKDSTDIDNPFTGGQTIFFNITESDVISVSNQTQIPFFLSTKSNSGSWKDCFYNQGGTMDNDGKCNVHYYISYICIKVSKSDSDKDSWVLDKSYGGYGCGPGKPISWPVAIYSLLRAKSSNNWIPDYSTVDLSTVVVEVRSAHDPYVVMNYLTDGKLDFGPTKVQQIQGGLAMVIVGCMLVLPPFMVAYMDWKQTRAQHSIHMQRFTSLPTHSSRSSVTDGDFADFEQESY